MNIATVQKASMALSLIAMLALAGCGGGGGSNVMNTGGPQPPGTGTGQPPPATPPTPTLAELIADPANSFEAVSSSLRQSSGRSSVTDRFSITAVTSDGDNGFHVTYVIDGTEATVHFQKTDLEEGGGSYIKEDGDRRHWLWSSSGGFDGVNYGIGTEFSYFDILGSSHGEGARIHSIYGNSTGSNDMPTGVAAYTGRMYADGYDNTLGTTRSSVARTRMQGNLVLTADFTDATLGGRIFRLRVRGPDDSGYENLASRTSRLEIAGGQIANGEFTATLTGVDDDANAPLEDSVRGVTGNVQGQFYGPNAREFGATFNASRSMDATDDWAIVGHLVGTRADVVGEHTDNEPLSAGVDRLDYHSASPRIVAHENNRVTSVEADAAGGYTISYLVDGSAQTVSLSVDDLGAGRSTDAYWKRTGTLDAWFRRAFNWFPAMVPQGRHYNVKDWAPGIYPDATTNSEDSRSWVSIVHGQRTASASMPQTGTATYAGRAAAYVLDPSPGEGNASSTLAEGYRGQLSLAADFTAGSISGRISGLEHSPRVYDRGQYSEVSGEFVIADGAISGNGLSGSLSGLGYTGTVSGAFYGPAVDEAAGVMQATGAQGKLLHGWFGGARQ